MKLWMKKTLVVLFTIVTFGLVSPPAALMTDKPSGQSSSLEQNDYTAFMMNTPCREKRRQGGSLNYCFNRISSSFSVMLKINHFKIRQQNLSGH